MAREITPTIRRWELGQRLRQLREQAGIRPLRSAKEIGVSTASLSRIETGKQAIKPLYVRILAVLYEVDPDVREELEVLAEEASQPEWYAVLARHTPDWFRQYLGYESVASKIQLYEPELVSGLLQTADYTRVIVSAATIRPTETELEKTVELRRARQERAATGGLPLHVVLNEAVLRRPVGGVDVMRTQLRHIRQLSALPSITVQVLPFAVGQHPSMTSGFALLGFESHPGMNTVYLENGRGALYLEGSTDLEQYGWRFGRLTELALPPEESLDLLVKVEADL